MFFYKLYAKVHL